jgi:hypothetical protein
MRESAFFSPHIPPHWRFVLCHVRKLFIFGNIFAAKEHNAGSRNLIADGNGETKKRGDVRGIMVRGMMGNGLILRAPFPIPLTLISLTKILENDWF